MFDDTICQCDCLLTLSVCLQLKKVINRVASELKDLGLTSEVLKDLLHQQEHEVQAQHQQQEARDAQQHQLVAPQRRRPSGTIQRTTGHDGLGTVTANVDHDSDQDEEKDQGSSSHVEVVEEAQVWDSSEDDDEAIAAARLKAARKGKRRAKRRAKATYELAGQCVSRGKLNIDSPQT